MTAEQLDALIARHGRTLTAFCISLCKNRHDANDLFQETCLKLLGARCSFADERAERNFIMKTCVNAFRDFYRAAARRREHLADVDEEYIEAIPDPGDQRKEYERLYRAIGRLSHKFRTVITLCYFQDLQEKDAASILGVPVGTVKSRLHQAKELLRKELEKDDDDR